MADPMGESKGAALRVNSDQVRRRQGGAPGEVL